jgi:hypothetical protein
MPAERIKVLREAFTKAMNDPALLADAQKRKWDLDLLSGEELRRYRKILWFNPEVIEDEEAVGKVVFPTASDLLSYIDCMVP